MIQSYILILVYYDNVSIYTIQIFIEYHILYILLNVYHIRYILWMFTWQDTNNLNIIKYNINIILI